MEKPNIVSATILNGAALSGAAPLGNASLVRIVTPAAWTAANLTFQTSYDGVNFSDLYDSAGTEYVVIAAAGREILLNLADFLGVRYVKVRSGTGSAPVNQAADRALQLVVLP